METRAKQEVSHQIVVIPKYIVPDTNCFIFDLISIQCLVSSGHFTVVIPLTGTKCGIVQWKELKNTFVVVGHVGTLFK